MKIRTESYWPWFCTILVSPDKMIFLFLEIDQTGKDKRKSLTKMPPLRHFVQLIYAQLPKRFIENVSAL